VTERIGSTPVPDETVWHPVLRTCRAEVAEACRRAGGDAPLSALDGEGLACLVETCSEETIAEIARKAGDYLIEGGDYWASLPLAAESKLFSAGVR
jgi:hypothetical protein